MNKPIKASLSESVHLPDRRETIRVLGAAGLIAAICWYFGVDVWHAILLGTAITIAGLATIAGTAYPEVRDLSWRSRERTGNKGSRTDVASLSWSLRSGWGLVGRTAEWRLQEIARRRLALEGLDLNNPDHGPAIERRIGRPAYKVLTRSHKRRLRRRTLVRCLDALDGRIRER
ncbi:MAG TPA: hypothetical protein VMF57_11830 [Solirubrobacteraceae bacterium]|nr:hypothetical protein [Solirubrobacteraceae bacterium]